MDHLFYRPPSIPFPLQFKAPSFSAPSFDLGLQVGTRIVRHDLVLRIEDRRTNRKAKRLRQKAARRARKRGMCELEWSTKRRQRLAHEAALERAALYGDDAGIRGIVDHDPRGKLGREVRDGVVRYFAADGLGVPVDVVLACIAAAKAAES